MSVSFVFCHCRWFVAFPTLSSQRVAKGILHILMVCLLFCFALFAPFKRTVYSNSCSLLLSSVCVAISMRVRCYLHFKGSLACDGNDSSR